MLWTGQRTKIRHRPLECPSQHDPLNKNVPSKCVRADEYPRLETVQACKYALQLSKSFLHKHVAKTSSSIKNENEEAICLSSESLPTRIMLFAGNQIKIPHCTVPRRSSPCSTVSKSTAPRIHVRDNKGDEKKEKI